MQSMVHRGARPTTIPGAIRSSSACPGETIPMLADPDEHPPNDEHTRGTDQANPWSPIQFDLKWILLITGCCAIVFGSIRVVGPAGIFRVILVLLGGWLAIGCIRVIRLSRRQ